MTSAPEPHDENLWLEDIHGAEAMAWVADQSSATLQRFASSAFTALSGRLREVLDSDDRVAYVHKRGELYYNFWRDSENPQGLWRRTTLESYRSPATQWDVLLDVDRLGRDEGVRWVFGGAALLPHDQTRALVRLSPDGADAVAIREFDLSTRSFVADGFDIPLAKGRASWIDRDTVFVATDFGEGTMTTSTYPRTVRRLRRGTALADAQLVHEIGAEDLLVGATHDHTRGFERDIVYEALDFYRSRIHVLTAEGLVLVDVPEDADATIVREWLLVRPRSDWTVGGAVHIAGSLLAFRIDDYLRGDRTVAVLFTPDARTALEDWAWTRSRLILTLLVDVSSRLVALDPDDGWSREPVPGIPELGTVRVIDTDPEDSDEYWLVTTGFTTPTSLLRGVIGEEDAAIVKTSASFFEESGFDVQQHWAISDDGTRVPYFQVARKGIELDGSHRTMLSGYGGFQNSRLPGYSGMIARAWLERGGVFVLANIRGGGEFGPAWHTAALKQNRHRAYEDFASIARDLVARGVTVAQRLACEGRSNGGLLVGNMLTSYPELFGAVVCGVPLLDMRRYTKLSAGASWMAEYGDPDEPGEWDYIRSFSPYHLLRDDVVYPPTLIYAATSDDRVGPVQGRKMAARMQTRGIPGVFYYENTDGGHGGAVDNAATARLHALMYEFAWRSLGE